MKLLGRSAISLLLAGGLLACSEPADENASPAESADAAASVREWRERRDASLRKPDGWLTLVGLHWLEEGDNAFGSAAENDVVIDGGRLGEYCGILARRGREVTLLPGAGVGLFIDGEPVSGATELAADTADGGPTIVESGSVSFYVVERGDLIGVRVKDSASPVLASFEGMDYFPFDPAWRRVGRYELFDEPRVLETPNVLGTVTEEEILGQVTFEAGGERYRLLPSGKPEDGFFLVFGDATNGVETYGGGRFVYAEPVAEDGSVVVDFNKAYSPPCVFTPYATCPLPPAENKLSLRIEAGEKTFAGAH